MLLNSWPMLFFICFLWSFSVKFVQFILKILSEAFITCAVNVLKTLYYRFQIYLVDKLLMSSSLCWKLIALLCENDQKWTFCDFAENEEHFPTNFSSIPWRILGHCRLFFYCTSLFLCFPFLGAHFNEKFISRLELFLMCSHWNLDAFESKKNRSNIFQHYINLYISTKWRPVNTGVLTLPDLPKFILIIDCKIKIFVNLN